MIEFYVKVHYLLKVFVAIYSKRSYEWSLKKIRLETVIITDA